LAERTYPNNEQILPSSAAPARAVLAWPARDPSCEDALPRC